MFFDIGYLENTAALIQQRRLGHELELFGALIDGDVAGFGSGARINCRLCGTSFHFKRDRGPDQDRAWELFKVSDDLPEERCTAKRIGRELAKRRRWERLEAHWKTLNE